MISRQKDLASYDFATEGSHLLTQHCCDNINILMKIVCLLLTNTENCNMQQTNSCKIIKLVCFLLNYLFLCLLTPDKSELASAMYDHCR